MPSSCAGVGGGVALRISEHENSYLISVESYIFIEVSKVKNSIEVVVETVTGSKKCNDRAGISIEPCSNEPRSFK